MKKLISAMALSLMIVIFYYFGIFWGSVMLICLFLASPFIAFAVLKHMKKGSSPSGLFLFLSQTRNYSTVYWIISLIVIAFLTWWLTSFQVQKSVAMTSSEITVVQPVEEWVFTQVNKNGDRPIFEVEITKREAGLLQAVIQRYRNNKRENIAGLRLNEVGDILVGTWVSYIDDDHGELTMYKQTGNVWSGQYKLQDETTRLCTLKRK